ncbi:MAG: class I SAM-dependent methyltransferase [Acidobacteriota bacterium]|nr:class I SAM-dependent methyltransferase [Acidobacteriota bacterium]
MVDWTRTSSRAVRLVGSLAAVPLLAVDKFAQTVSRVGPDGDPYRFHRLLLPRELLRRVEGMTSSHERAFFEWYARHLFRGDGEIVDLGAWLGSTTVSLARGLTRNHRPEAGKRSIYAYDTFLWDEWMRGYASAELNRRLQPGDSFLPVFEERVQPWRDRVRSRPGDLTRVTWDSGPIEFLLVDAMKSWELAASILRNFVSAVRPGGFVLQQDFCHFWEAWVHPIHFRLREYLVPVYDVPLSASFLFRLERPVPEALLEQALGFDAFERDEIDRAFSWATDIVSGYQRPAIAAAKVRFLHLAGALDEARHELESFRAMGLSFHSDLDTVEKELLSAGDD